MTKRINLLHNSMVDLDCLIDLKNERGCFSVSHGNKSESFPDLNEAVEHFFMTTEQLFDAALRLVELQSTRQVQLVISKRNK